MDPHSIISAIMNFAACLACLFIVRQSFQLTKLKIGSWLYRSPFIVLSIIKFLKGWDAIEGQRTSFIDLSEDVTTMILVLVIAVFRYKRFNGIL